GMDLDAGEAAAPLADHAREKKVFFLIQPVRDAVEDQRMKARIQQHHLREAARGGVFFSHRARVVQQTSHRVSLPESDRKQYITTCGPRQMRRVKKHPGSCRGVSSFFELVAQGLEESLALLVVFLFERILEFLERLALRARELL